jgi:hypothetical protein
MPTKHPDRSRQLSPRIQGTVYRAGLLATRSIPPAADTRHPMAEARSTTSFELRIVEQALKPTAGLDHLRRDRPVSIHSPQHIDGAPHAPDLALRYNPVLTNKLALRKLWRSTIIRPYRDLHVILVPRQLTRLAISTNVVHLHSSAFGLPHNPPPIPLRQQITSLQHFPGPRR